MAVELFANQSEADERGKEADGAVAGNMSTTAELPQGQWPRSREQREEAALVLCEGDKGSVVVRLAAPKLHLYGRSNDVLISDADEGAMGTVLKTGTNGTPHGGVYLGNDDSTSLVDGR